MNEVDKMTYIYTVLFISTDQHIDLIYIILTFYIYYSGNFV